MSKKSKEPEKPGIYARDGLKWRFDAGITYDAAMYLFASKDRPTRWFPAGVLGHHALEKLLKSALIESGYTIAKGNVWGHNLMDLAVKLAKRNPSFPLQDLRIRLSVFDAYFNELRYPRNLENADGVGQDEVDTLTNLMQQIAPFATPVPKKDQGGDETQKAAAQSPE